MKEVAQIIKNNQNYQHSKNEQSHYPNQSTKTGISLTNCQTIIDSRVKVAIDGIWDVYSRKFGNKFQSTLIADDRDYMIWYSAIKGLSVKDIEQGKRSVLAWHSDNGQWFPDEKEFRIMCMGISDIDIRSLKNLTLRWSYLLKEEFKDNLEFRRAKWILSQMAIDEVAHFYKNSANHAQANKLFNEYFNQVIALGYDDLDPVPLMIEQKDNSSRENVKSILADIKNFL